MGQGPQAIAAESGPGPEGPGPEGPGPAAGRLNDFQRTMLQWSALHPYNAVHVARVAASIEPEHFAACAARILAAAGLTNYSLRERGGRYRYAGGPAPCEIRVVAGGDDPDEILRGEVERQLNEPFARDGRFQPFRFFLVEAGGETYAGLAYFHVVADADAISRLLIEILAAVRDAAPEPLRDKGLRRRGSSRPPRGSVLLALRRVRGAWAKFQAMRRCHRSPVCPMDGGQANRWFARSLEPGQTAAALARARERGATFNDLCLAALLLAAAPATAERFGQRRDRLAAACVVNLRGELPERRRGDFGLYLGSFSVTHPLPPGTGLDGLLAAIRGQTLVVKRDKLYLASALEYRLNRLLFAMQKPAKRPNFYRKAFPVWGSLTNFKMELGSTAAATAGIVDYHRAVSTGPALPYVVSITGAGGRLHFGFSYRPELVDEGSVAAIADRFLALLAGKEAVS